MAPGYAYTGALRQALGRRFRWWADAMHVHLGAVEPAAAAARAELAPAISLARAGRLAHAPPSLLLRAAAVLPTAALRIDIHPDDLAHPRRMLALEWVLARSVPGRAAVTYEDLAARARARPPATPGASGLPGAGGAGPLRRGDQGSIAPAVPAAMIDAER